MNYADLILPQLLLLGHDIYNAWNDARLIRRNKPIMHWLNAVIYCALIVAYWTIWHFPWLIGAVFVVSALAGRALWFDLALNKFRGLPWNYFNPIPASWIDRMEVRMFGHNGTRPVVFYAVVWIVLLVIMKVV